MAIQSNLSRSTRYAMLGLALVAVTLTVALIAALTHARIEANQRAWFVARLDALIPTALHDNDLYTDAIRVSAPDFLGEASTSIYRARRNHAPTASILEAVAPDGYGGPIELLIAIDYSGTVIGVDIIRHNETKGIGDGFDPRRSTWLRSLTNRSLRNPAPTNWTIHKDGGAFDQFTGASVTPRAILKAVRRALEYYVANRDTIFAQAPSP